MKQRKTTECKLHGHAEFSLFFDDHIIDPWIDWLVDYLEQSVETEKYVDGETMQIGWMVNLIKRDGEDLTIYEPDFEAMPVNWIKSVSATLTHMFLQRYVADSVGLTEQMDFPRFNQTAICCNKFGKNGIGFLASRFAPSANNPEDSGWFLSCLEPTHDHNSAEILSLISLYEAATINKFIVPYLALPEQICVMETGNPDDFTIGMNDDELPIERESYLQRWLSDRRMRDANFDR